ncbi:MAG: DUF4352 domain-containing protein [Thermomicrobiales bacterium]
MPRRWLRWALIVAVLAPMLVTVAGTRERTRVVAQEASPAASPVASPAATPAASPIADSPGEPGPAFVSGEWRIALVAADRSPGINALSLERGAGRTWIVVVADVTNWSANESALDLRNFRLFFPEESNPGGFAPKSTTDVAAILGTEPRQLDTPIAFAADETKRVSVAFQVSVEYTVPAIRYGDEALSLDDLLEAEVDFDVLPPVTPAPTLERVLIDDIISGNEIEVFLRETDENQRIHLIGLDVPTDGACFASQSTDGLAALTTTAVLVERDPTAGDNGEVVQRYLWVQDEDGQRTLLNRVMILEGFAVWSGEPADTRFAEWLQQAQRIGRETDAGLWGQCGGLEDPLAAPAASPTAEVAEPDETGDATPDLTPEATEEPADEATPEATSTILPESEAAATLEPSDQYPAAVAALAAEDTAETCDRIGWGTPDEETLADDPLDYYAACHEAGGVYVARCVGSAEGTGSLAPGADRLWIICVVVIANSADDPLFVSPVDFVLVDGDDGRYELDSAAMRALPGDRVLQSGEVAAGEQVSGAVAFDVPSDGTRPFRLEIVPLVEANAETTQPAIIIIDPNAAPPE